MDNESFLQSVGINFDRAAGLLGLSDDLAKKIKIANSIYIVRFGSHMRGAYDAISGTWNDKDNVPDLRTAAMMIAVDRVAKSYISIGI